VVVKENLRMYAFVFSLETHSTRLPNNKDPKGSSFEVFTTTLRKAQPVLVVVGTERFVLINWADTDINCSGWYRSGGLAGTG